MLIKLYQSKLTKSSVSSGTFPEPRSLPDAQVIPVYDTVFPMEFQEENMELNDNISYGTIHKLPAGRIPWKCLTYSGDGGNIIFQTTIIIIIIIQKFGKLVSYNNINNTAATCLMNVQYLYTQCS